MLIKNCKVTIRRKSFNEQTESNSLTDIYTDIDWNFYQDKRTFWSDIIQNKINKSWNLLISNVNSSVQKDDEVEIIIWSMNIWKFVIDTIRPYVQFSWTLKLTLKDGEI